MLGSLEVTLNGPLPPEMENRIISVMCAFVDVGLIWSSGFAPHSCTDAISIFVATDCAALSRTVTVAFLGKVQCLPPVGSIKSGLSYSDRIDAKKYHFEPRGRGALTGTRVRSLVKTVYGPTPPEKMNGIFVVQSLVVIVDVNMVSAGVADVAGVFPTAVDALVVSFVAPFVVAEELTPNVLHRPGIPLLQLPSPLPPPQAAKPNARIRISLFSANFGLECIVFP